MNYNKLTNSCNRVLFQFFVCIAIFGNTIVKAQLTEHSSNALSTTYGIGDKLLIKVPGKYLSNYRPKWDLICDEGKSCRQNVGVKVENFEKTFPYSEFNIAISLRVESGKTLFYWDGIGGCGFISDIVTSDGNTVLLTNVPQVFRLQNFRILPDEKCNEIKFVNEFYSYLNGKVTMMADEDGRISISYIIDAFLADGKLSMRFNSETKIFPNGVPIEVANDFSKNEKYISLVESLVKQHYEGWNFEKYYVPNSVRNIRTMQKDPQGIPTVINAEMDFNYNGVVAKPVNLLFEKGFLYGFTMWGSGSSETIITPYKKNGSQIIPYSNEELEKIDLLQNKYMYTAILKKYASIPMEYFNRKHLVPVKETRYDSKKTTYTETEYESYTNTSGAVITYPITKEKSFTTLYPYEVEVFKNAGTQPIHILCIEKVREQNGLSYKDKSYVIEPGSKTESNDFTPQFTLDSPDGSTGFILNKTILAGKTSAAIPQKTSSGNKAIVANKEGEKKHIINYPEPATILEKVNAKKLSTNSFEIDSRTNTTDLNIKKGDKLSLTASGSVTYGGWAGSGGPGGIDGYTSYNRIEGFKHGSLLVRIGDDGEWEAVGTSKSIIAKNSGVLQFVVNDDDPSNNSGSFIVEFGINKEIKPTSVTIKQPKVEEEQNKVVDNKETPVPNNPPVTIQKSVTDNGPKTILEDFFADNKNNWESASDKHILNIGGNRMTYENKEKDDKVYSMVSIPVSLTNDDNYTVEVSIQSLTPCENKEVNNLVSLVSKKPKPVFYGFAIGNEETDILFAVGSNIQSRETRDNVKYTCNPSYFITSSIAGNSNYIQDWTKNYSIADGSNVNILKLTKLNGRFSFYISNRLVTTKNSYPLSNGNAISIVTSAKSKVSVNYIKIYKN